MRDQFYIKIGLSDKKVNSVDLPSFKYDEIVDRIENLADNTNMKKTDKDRQRAKRFKLKVTNLEGIVVKTSLLCSLHTDPFLN